MLYDTLPPHDRLQKTIDAVRLRGIAVTLVDSKGSVLPYIQTIIPAGASVMTGASVSLRETGVEALLISGNHPWRYIKAEILAEKDPIRQLALRKQAALADYFLGSVHAIAESGEILIASATGSQLAAYAYTSANVVWVAGAQKITPTLENAFQRVRQYVLPLEDRHMKQLYGEEARSFIGKILVFEKEAPYLHRSVNLVLVNEVLGF
jgi:hypothetical protein